MVCIAEFEKEHNKGVWKEVRVSCLVMLACKGAHAFTYPGIQGTNIVLRNCTTIVIPSAYVEAAFEFASSDAKWRYDNPEKVNRGAAISTDVDMRMSTFARMTAILMYSFWKGLPEAMYHVDGGRPCCVQAVAPQGFIDCQNRITRTVFNTCESFLEVNQWYHEEHLGFTTEKHLIMLRDAIIRMQNNNRSQTKRAGDSKAGDDANWGGHGLGEVAHFIEPGAEMCPIPQEETQRNDLLGIDKRAA